MSGSNEFTLFGKNDIILHELLAPSEEDPMDENGQDEDNIEDDFICEDIFTPDGCT